MRDQAANPGGFLLSTKHDHVLGLAFGRKIKDTTVEGGQSPAATNREGQQVRIGDLRVTTQAFPSDVLVAGDLNVIRPENVAGQGGNPSQDFPRFAGRAGIGNGSLV